LRRRLLSTRRRIAIIPHGEGDDRQDAQARADRFIERVLARNPELREHYAKLLAGEGGAEGLVSREAGADDLLALLANSSNAALEALVSEERPALFIAKDWRNFRDVAVIGLEAQQLV